jgi:two-component system nitrogen regulation sensor histidine kinase GlnL
MPNTFPNIAVDSLQVAVVILDRGARVCSLNAAAQAMWGSALNHALGATLDHWFADDETLATLQTHMGQGKNEVCRGVLKLLRSNESGSALVHVVLSPVSSSDENPRAEPLSYCLECHQLGSYEHANQDNQWRAQVQNHQDLMRLLAHEVKNPLGGIRGAAQLLQDELREVAPELTEYTEMMLTQVDRLKNLVDQFLVPYRKGNAQMAALNVHEVCEAVYRIAKIEFPQIEWVRDYDVSVPNVVGVSNYLQQLLLNLVQNAAQAVQRNDTAMPHVIIKTRVARNTMVGHTMHHLMVELSVIDNGAGVPPEIYDTLFLPMVTQREGGTGLGLSVAMQIAQQHGGTIEVDSRVGHTQMKLLLPVAKA